MCAYGSCSAAHSGFWPSMTMATSTGPRTPQTVTVRRNSRQAFLLLAKMWTFKIDIENVKNLVETLATCGFGSTESNKWQEHTRGVAAQSFPSCNRSTQGSSKWRELKWSRCRLWLVKPDPNTGSSQTRESCRSAWKMVPGGADSGLTTGSFFVERKLRFNSPELNGQTAWLTS